MTAEEYLSEHCKPEDWNNLEECLKDSILTNNVVKHMERYADLRIHNVSGRAFSIDDMRKAFNAGARNGSRAGMRVARGGDLNMEYFDDWFPKHYR